MAEETRLHIGDRKLWVRVLYMLFCAIAYGAAEFVAALIAVFQIGCVVLTGSINERAQQLGQNVAEYIRELLRFSTFNTERVPFPFSDWPDVPPGESPWAPAPEGADGPGPAASADDTADAAAPAPEAPDAPDGQDAPVDRDPDTTRG